MKNIKKTIFTAVLLGVLIVPGFASAQATTAELQAQIQALFAQIKQLQAELNASQSAVSTSAPLPIISESQVSSVIIQPSPIPPRECFTIKRRLHRGSRDSSTGGEVAELQRFLAQDSSIYPEALVTGYFGSLTERAVKKWQAKNGVVSSGSAASTGYGVVGPKTRIKIKSFYKCRPLPIPGNQPPVIHGVEGPTALNIGQSGNWTVNASDPENRPLSYSVEWGDGTGGGGGGGPLRSETAHTFSQTITFTHSYSNASVYYPVFTVSDNIGQMASTSVSVRVGSDTVIEDIIAQIESLLVIIANLQKQLSDCLNPVSLGDSERAVSSAEQVLSNSDSTIEELQAQIAALLAIISNLHKQINECQQSQPSITVISPNGGESWEVGETRTIRWSSSSVNKVSIWLCEADVCGRFGTIPPTGVINTGSYSFVVSTSTTPFGAYIPANNLKIRVASEDDYPVSSVYDDSDAVFSIVDISTNAPSITVISPNGGEILTQGQQYTIRWNESSTPFLTHVGINLFDITTGNNILAISNASNTGSYVWTIPNNITGLSEFKIQIIGNGVIDYSDAPFSIVEAGTETLTASSGVQPEQAIAFRGQEDIPFTAVNLTASGDDVSIRYFTVERAGVGDDEAFSRISILDENGREMGRSSLNANSQAVINVSLRVRDGEEKQITIAADRSTDIGYGGQIAYFSLVNIDSDAETLGGLPITGTGHTLSDTSIDEVGYSPQLSQMANTLQVAQGILEKMIESLKNW